MAATRYRQFLKLCKEWPVDVTKESRDFAVFLKAKVAESFPAGDVTTIDDDRRCEERYRSLQRLLSNHYKSKYPCGFSRGATGLNADECRAVLSEEGSRAAGLRPQ